MTADDLAVLSKKTIYFGHQSVGENIMDGVAGIVGRQHGTSLEVVRTDGPPSSGRPVFAHSLNGENEQPLTKIAEFRDRLDAERAAPIDIAFFKFCYVDIRADSDVDGLFETYRTSMRELRLAHPSTVFVHVTAPLTTVQSGPKAWVKRILGRADGYALANVTRAAFNDRLRAEYGGKEPVFDLAALEGRSEDGRRRSFTHEGATYDALREEYTDDGKHLNARGSVWIAANLLHTLAEIARRGHGA